VPSAFYQHHYVREDSKPERLTPRKLFSSPVTKNIEIEQDMMNSYTVHSSSTKLAKADPDHYPSDCSPLFHTPIKNQKTDFSSIPTTLPTPLNLPVAAKPNAHPNDSGLASGLSKSQKKERKLMIVDEWALNTEREIKKSIILSEFFKMVLDQD